jgi:hypothetical protein
MSRGRHVRVVALVIGFAYPVPMPSQSSFPTEPSPTFHVHNDDTWEWGATCDGCFPAPSHFVPLNEFQAKVRSIRWNTKQLGDKHTTVRAEVQEHYDRAKRDGRDITRI